MREYCVTCEVCGAESLRGASSEDARYYAALVGWHLEGSAICPDCWSQGMEMLEEIADEAADIVRVRIAE